jgi:ketosteroid isomerase-like protein
MLPLSETTHAVDVVSRYFSAMRCGDYDAGLRFYAENALLNVPGHSRHAGTHRGRDAIRRYFEAALAAAPAGVQIELVDMLASRTRVALVLHERFYVDGGVVEIQRANVYRVSDGEITEVRLFEANQYELDALVGTRKDSR